MGLASQFREYFSNRRYAILTRPLTLFLLLLLAVVFAGCQSAAKKREKQKKDDEAHYRDTTTNLALIEAEALGADGELVKLMGNLTEKPAPNIQMAIARATSVRGSLGKIIPGVRLAGKEVLTAKNKNDDLGKQVDDLIADRDKPVFWWMTAFFVFGACLAIVGLIASALSSRMPKVPVLEAGGDLAMIGFIVSVVSLAGRLSYSAILPYKWIPGLTTALAISVGIVWFGWKAIRRVRFKRISTNLRKGIRHADNTTPQDMSIVGKVAEVVDDPATTQFLASTTPTPT